MMLGTVKELESDRLQVVAQREVPLSSFEAAEEFDLIAFKLWQHASCPEMIGDECWFCKGEAQRCYATCR
jgi:hypothetical protein